MEEADYIVVIRSDSSSEGYIKSRNKKIYVSLSVPLYPPVHPISLRLSKKEPK